MPTGFPLLDEFLRPLIYLAGFSREADIFGVIPLAPMNKIVNVAIRTRGKVGAYPIGYLDNLIPIQQMKDIQQI